MGSLSIKINDNVDNVYCDNNKMLYDEKEQQFYCEVTNGKHKIIITKKSNKIMKVKCLTTWLKFNYPNHLCSIQNNIEGYEYKIDIVTYREDSLMIFKKEIFCIENNAGVAGEISTLKNTDNSNIKVENIFYKDNVKKIWSYFLINVFFTTFIVALELIWPSILLVDLIKNPEDAPPYPLNAEICLVYTSIFMIIIICELINVIIKSIYYMIHYRTFYRIVKKFAK